MYTIVDEYKSIVNEYKGEIATMRKTYSQEIATMSKAYNQALATKDKVLATKDKALATKDKALQKALAENEKLRRQFGINSQIIETDN